MSRNLLEKLQPSDWKASQLKHLQGIDDLVNRPVNNRVTSTGTPVINTNGAIQSSGIGTGNAMTPKRYAEFTVKLRVSFNVNSVGPVYLYVMRTTGAVPANGAVPNGGDVEVSGDSFWGGPTANGVNQSASFSFLDSGLLQTQAYRYYLAVKAPNGNTLNIINNSQMLVMERS